MTGRRDLAALIGLAIVVAMVTGLGIGVRATYGAQTTADEPQYLLSALSLWEDRSLDISDELADERYRDFHEVELPQQTRALAYGRRISPHDPLLPLLLAVPMGLGGWVAAKASLGILGGVLAALTAWTMITRFDVSEPVAFTTAGVFALAPPLAIYATQVYPALPAALVTLAGFAAITGPFGRKGRVVLVLAVTVLPWLAVKFIPVAAVLAVAGLVRATGGQRMRLLGIFVGASAIYIVGHLVIYGGLTPYATGYHFVGGEFTAIGTHVNLWGRSSRLIGLIVDRGFGIGAWQPAFLALPQVGAWAIARRRAGFNVAVSILGVGWLVATFVALTMHGWWFPGRQLVVVLPVAVVLMGAWVDRSRRWQAATLAALGVFGVVAFVFLVAEGLGAQLTWVVDFGATSNPFYRTLSTVLPDYMTPTTTTWLLHGVWVSFAAALAWLGWRSGKEFEVRSASLVSGRRASPDTRYQIPDTF
ncbi:MAG TPA: hypothetical protein VE569_13485 [Acidimicrobiia bacterium]|nr:hypothetical protein [Acidimicrobiia bacterium]